MLTLILKASLETGEWCPLDSVDVDRVVCRQARGHLGPAGPHPAQLRGGGRQARALPRQVPPVGVHPGQPA